MVQSRAARGRDPGRAVPTEIEEVNKQPRVNGTHWSRLGLAHKEGEGLSLSRECAAARLKRGLPGIHRVADDAGHQPTNRHMLGLGLFPQYLHQVFGERDLKLLFASMIGLFRWQRRELHEPRQMSHYAKTVPGRESVPVPPLSMRADIEALASISTLGHDPTVQETRCRKSSRFGEPLEWKLASDESRKEIPDLERGEIWMLNLPGCPGPV